MEYALYRLLVSAGRVFAMDSGQIPIRRHGLSHVETYEVRADELKRLEEAGSDVGFDFQVAQFCLTLAAAFFIGLIAPPPNEQHIKMYIVFVVVVIVGVLLGLIFGIKWLRSRRAFSGVVQEIRERQIGPVGAEGKELKATDLARLPSTEPPPQGGAQ